MNPIGLNILAQFLHNQEAPVTWVREAQPAACIVMDETKLAQKLRDASPNTLVIYRDSRDENKWQDSHHPNDFTPQQWLDNHTDFAANGVILQVFNELEPGSEGAGEFVNWLTKLISLANARNITLALPTFAVGHPDESLIKNGTYDDLLRALAGSRHYLLLHEYFLQHPLGTDEFGSWVGRFQFWLDRANKLGLQAPKIIIGEHGRDKAGDKDKDGWSKQGWSEEEYFNRLLEAQPLYQQHGIPVCVYCYGFSWPSFDIQKAGTLLDNLKQYGKDHPLQAASHSNGHVSGDSGVQPVPEMAIDRTTLGDPVEGTILSVKGTYTNIRATPSTSAKILGRLHPGDAIRYRPQQTAKLGKYHWYALEAPVQGWFADVATPQPNP